jgi:hypothetical protein
MQHEGGAIQPPPPESRRSGSPLMPPVMSPAMSQPPATPTQPSWKQEVHGEAAPQTNEPTPGSEPTPESGS